MQDFGSYIIVDEMGRVVTDAKYPEQYRPLVFALHERAEEVKRKFEQRYNSRFYIQNNKLR